jgi:hypothetical protein
MRLPAAPSWRVSNAHRWRLALTAVSTLLPDETRLPFKARAQLDLQGQRHPEAM